MVSVTPCVSVVCFGVAGTCKYERCFYNIDGDLFRENTKRWAWSRDFFPHANSSLIVLSGLLNCASDKRAQDANVPRN